VDRSQLDQVLLNLFVNARAAMNGAGVLTVATRSAVLLDPTPDGPETVPPGRYTVIEVADTGAGIAPDFLPRIFEPFVSGTGGTGLGLATVHGIVRQSGGYIGVASALGQGTSFRIYLPREDEQPAPARTMPEPATGAGQTDTVLLVEDEAPVRRLAQRALEATGFVVIAVDSGEEALARLDRGDHPGIIVTDLSMPGMSGSALLDAARARVPGLPAVVMSGYADPDVRAGLDAAGPVRFLAKPFGMDALIEAVRKEIRAVAPA
jgi:two-component system cell cycle sensor histidine kinase/response regulator CckA